MYYDNTNKSTAVKEIEFQTQMLNNLKKWIRNLIILSSIGVILAYWGLGVQSKMPFTVFGVAGVIITIISVILCVVIGLGIKRGRANVDKILQLVKA